MGPDMFRNPDICAAGNGITYACMSFILQSVLGLVPMEPALLCIPHLRPVRTQAAPSLIRPCHLFFERNCVGVHPEIFLKVERNAAYS